MGGDKNATDTGKSFVQLPETESRIHMGFNVHMIVELGLKSRKERI